MVEINFSHAESLFLHETLEASNVSCRKRGEKRERERERREKAALHMETRSTGFDLIR